MEHCPNCAGRLRIIAAILESAVIDRILTHLGLQARAPPRVPARGDLQQAACPRPGPPGGGEGLRLTRVEAGEGPRSVRVYSMPWRLSGQAAGLRPNLRIFVNGLSIRDLGHGLQPDDFVAVVLALSGG